MTNKDLKDIQYHCRPQELSTFRMKVYLLLNYFTMSKKVFKLIWNSIMPDASISELTYSLKYLAQIASIIEKSEYTQGNDGDLVKKLYILKDILEKSKYNRGYYYMPTALGELQFQGFCQLNAKLNESPESHRVKLIISDLLIAKCNDIASRNGGRHSYHWAKGEAHKMRRLLYMDELIKDVILLLPES